MGAVWLTGIPDGADYSLQVSVEGMDVNPLVFSPQPQQEDEQLNNTAQNIDDSDAWYDIHNPNIGNGSTIDDSMAYTIIQGIGNGSTDIYEFTVTDEMVNPSAGTIIGSIDSGTFYKQVNLSLAGR